MQFDYDTLRQVLLLNSGAMDGLNCAKKIEITSRALRRRQQEAERAAKLEFRVRTTSERVVLLVRHGEGLHNVRARHGGLDIVDPLLTDRGRQQAAALVGSALLAGCELLVVSPLSRAIQTAAVAFGEEPRCRVVLSPLHSERWCGACDEGRPKEALARAFPFIRRWEGFDTLEEHWTPTKETDADWSTRRVQAFLAWLRAQPERRPVVIGHGAFFGAVLGRHLRNCEIAELTAGATRNVGGSV
jgi:broad specificity phosphatase PhoE